MAHSDCEWTCGCAGKTVKSLAIPERFCGGDSLRRGAISSVCTFTFTFALVQHFKFWTNIGYSTVALDIM